MCTPRKLQAFPPDAKIITYTWAIKKKADGTYQERLNTRGYKQVEGLHFYAVNITMPFTNDMSLCNVMVLTFMAGWIAKIFDLKGAYLHGEFYEG